MDDYKKEMYASLGLLSVKFAIMEYNLIQILINLINNDEDLVTLHLIEKNKVCVNINCKKWSFYLVLKKSRGASPVKLLKSCIKCDWS